MELKYSKTQRNFDLIEFRDYYNEGSSIQKSSLATIDAIWFGIDNPNPKFLGTSGWEHYPIPDNVLINTLMHLNREQVAKLLPIFLKFVDSGVII